MLFNSRMENLDRKVISVISGMQHRLVVLYNIDL